MDTDFKDIKKQYNELKALWGTEKSRNLSDEEALRYQDVLELLQERGYIMNLRVDGANLYTCLLYTSPSPRDLSTSRMPSSA